MKCIGFDAAEDHRVGGGGTYATPKNMDICPEKGLPPYRDRYDVRYPLRDWGLRRVDCGKIIADAGLPIPPKSACFFCPAMKKIEIERLRVVDPDQYVLAIEMEKLYRTGRHFRGDNSFSLRGVRRETGEKVQLDVTGADPADVRRQFREVYDDTQRPYRWKLSISPSVPGLGRNFAWGDHPEVLAEDVVIREPEYNPLLEYT